MKNRKAALVITFVMAVSLLGSGCSGQNAETGNTNTAEAEASTETVTEEKSSEEAIPETESTVESSTEEVSTEEDDTQSEKGDGDIIIPVIEHHVIERSDDKGTYYYSRYDSISLGDRGSQYTDLENVLSERSAEIAANAEGEADNLSEEDRSYREETGIEQPFYSNNVIYTKRADKDVFSFIESSESYMGGAHGMYGLFGNNYHTSDGSAIELSEVVKDMDRLKKDLADKLNKEYADAGFFDDPETALQAYGDNAEAGEIHFNWVLENEGITFIFNPYEIAPYAAGQQIVTIRYDEDPELFTGNIQENTGNSVQEFGFYQNVSVFDKDGNKRILNAGADYDYDAPGQYAVYPVIAVEFDYSGNKLKDTDIKADGAYDIRMYLAHTSDGDNRILIESGKDGGTKTTSIYVLGDDGSIKKSGVKDGDVRSNINAI
ncbi:MAG: RsiV family protein [Lachnospiraceae bacterium]|nr:RsiV family protein [Lachnospiraceae bacterium]